MQNDSELGADLVALARAGYSVGIAPEPNRIGGSPVQAAVVFQREGRTPIIYSCSLLDTAALPTVVREFREQVAP